MRRFAPLVVVAALLAPPASATPVGVDGMAWEIQFKEVQKGTFLDIVGEDCLIFGGADWARTNYGDRRISIYRGPVTRAKGSYDAVARRGAANEELVAFHLETVGTRRAVNLEKIGIEVDGRRAYVTGVVARAKAQFAAAAPKRVRLAVIAHPRFLSGPATVPRHPSKTQPDSFLIAVRGKAKVMPALSAAIERIRCKSPTGVLRPRRLKPGTPFGYVTVQMRPNGAAGLAGSVFMRNPDVDAGGEPVAVAPLAPAVSATVSGTRGIRFRLPAGTAALDCEFGFRCAPAAGAQLSLAGGFTLAHGGRTTMIAGLQAFYDKPPDAGTPEAGLAGSVDGQAMTIAAPTVDGTSATREFLAAISAALGLEISDVGFFLTPTFTDTGPL